jgi:hypothetical protein
MEAPVSLRNFGRCLVRAVLPLSAGHGHGEKWTEDSMAPYEGLAADPRWAWLYDHLAVKEVLSLVVG